MDSKLLCFILATMLTLDASNSAFGHTSVAGKAASAVGDTRDAASENEDYASNPDARLFSYAKNQYAVADKYPDHYKNDAAIIAKYKKASPGRSIIKQSGKYGSDYGGDKDYYSGDDDKGDGYNHHYNYGYSHGHDYHHHHHAHHGDVDGHGGNDNHDYHNYYHVHHYDHDDADHNGREDYAYDECDYHHGHPCHGDYGYQGGSGAGY